MTSEILQPSPDGTAPEACLNCASLLHGHYCAHCGQPHRPLDPGLHDLLHEATHEFLHLDGKILATLKALLFFPGRLTAEFLAGRRARFIGPIRLYLTMSLLFFLLMGYSTDKSIKVESGPPNEATIHLSSKDSHFSQWLNHSIAHALDDPRAFRREMMANSSHVMFVLVPLFALLLRMVYIKRKLRYPSFVYFSLHVHALFFFAFTLLLLTGLVKNDALDETMGWAVFLGLPVYLFLAMRRVFGGTRRRTALRLALLSAVYFPCLLVGLIAALFLTIAMG
jgi:hypothetical protein